MSEVEQASPSPRRLYWRWIEGVLVLAIAAAVAFLLVGRHMPYLACCELAAGIAWILYRQMRANGGGILLWYLAILMLCLASQGDIGAALIGLVLGVAGSLTFFVVAVIDRTRRVRHCACATLAFFSLIVGINVGRTFWIYNYCQANERCSTQTFVNFHKLDDEVSSLQARLGRLPADEEEFVAMRGSPLPAYSEQCRIHYVRAAADDYYFKCMLSNFWGCAGDFWGWIVVYNGANAPRPVYVELF